MVEVKTESKVLGGASNVAQNLVSLGAEPLLYGVIGDDKVGQEVFALMEEMGISREGVVIENDRPTTIKTRVIAHNQQVVRVDRESKESISPETLQKMLRDIEKRIEQFNVILISDYGKGVIGSALMTFLREKHRMYNSTLAVDPKVGNFDFYKGVSVITPNHHEAGFFCRFPIDDQETLARAGNKMLSDLECSSVIITQGKDGMTIFEDNGEMTHIPTMAKQVYDVTGAGDTVISTLSLGLSVGLDLKLSAILANLAAGIVVGHVGTYPVRVRDLLKAIQDFSES